jgi:hypothetical protein
VPPLDGPSDHDLTESPAIRVAAGIIAGFGLLALVNGLAIAVAVPLPSAGLGLGLAHLGFDAAETVGLGALVAGFAAGFVRFVRVPFWVRNGLAFLVAIALVNIVIGEYLVLQAAHAWNGVWKVPVLINYFALFGVTLTVSPLVGAYCATRPRLRFVPVAISISVMIANQSWLRDDYDGIHGLVDVAAALLAGPAFASTLVRVGHTMSRDRAGRIGLGTMGAFALLGLVIPPPNAVRCELFRQPCAVASWALATAYWRLPTLHAPVTVPASPWLADRSRMPAIAPTTPPPLPNDAVVVLITVDAVGADVLANPTNEARFPTFTRLRRESVVFDHASAPATQTPLSIGTMLSGLYFSEQRWADFGSGADRFPYPAADPYPRVPALLTEHGVATIHEASFVFLGGTFGVARGFHDEKVRGRSSGAASGKSLITGLLERLDAGLANGRDGPMFAYTHLAEPHAPYERYLAAITEADSQVGRVLQLLEQRLGTRWVLVVSADHGEAFGEHESYEHAKTLYEELLHVPLLVRSPRFAPHHVSERVGLVDVGPTLLDLLQTDTPATMNGQSLVPFLTGQSVTITRPLLAEGRLRQAYTQQDGFKVIEDPRRTVVEAFDLATDPKETRNVFDAEPARSDAALAMLRAFFAAKTRHEDGYEPPYKP